MNAASFCHLEEHKCIYWLFYGLSKTAKPQSSVLRRRGVQGCWPVCVYGVGGPRAHPLAWTVDSQMEPHGLPQSHSASVYGVSRQTLRLRGIRAFTQVHNSLSQARGWPQRRSRSLALQDHASPQPGSWGTGPFLGTRGLLRKPLILLCLPHHQKMLCQSSGIHDGCETSGKES